MAGAKRVPVEVVQRAQSALTKQYTVAPTPKPTAPAAPKAKRLAKDKVVAALKRLHPMD